MSQPPCNCEKLLRQSNGSDKFVECGREAYWKHPRYPTGRFCDECKLRVEEFFPNNWSKIDGDYAGRN